MFPIHDFSRAGDIRMRRRRAVWLLAGILLAAMLLLHGLHPHRSGNPGSSGTTVSINVPGRSIHSDSLPATEIQSVLNRIPLIGHLDWMVQGAPLPTGSRDGSALSATGQSLRIQVQCARSITLVPQRDLPDRVFISSRDGRPAAGFGLRLAGDDTLGAKDHRLTLSGGCGNGDADLVVQAPAAMPLMLESSGNASIRLGAFEGPVHLISHGDGDVVIDAAGPLDVEMTGSGDVTVGRLSGSLKLVQAGSNGDVEIAQIQAARVSISGDGNGNISIAAGHVDQLNAVMHGNGDLSVKAEIGNASVQAIEASDITLPHVKGRLDQHTLPD